MKTIYIIRNSVNDKVYIGRTGQTLKMRMYAHHAKLRKGDHASLQGDYDRYGWDVFEIEEIEKADKPQEREQYWIDFYGDRVYNRWNAVNPDLNAKPMPGYEKRIKGRLRKIYAEHSPTHT